MEEPDFLLTQYAARYPLSEPADLIKLLFQREFGGGHLIRDEKDAEAFLCSEWRNTPKDPGAVRSEEIGGGMTRVNLAALPESSLSAASKLFVRDANRRQGNPEHFKAALSAARTYVARGDFRFDIHAFDNAVRAYLSAGIRPVSHSEAYRRAYHPAYRIMEVSSAALIEPAAKLMSLLRSGEKHPVTVGLDGRCASGKSTAAEALGDIFHASVLHMDDFFLPPEKRTAERLQTPGGNCDTERFACEVLPALRSGKEFSYRVFSCRKMDFDGARRISPADVILVEGSYAMHPSFGQPYDLTFFFDTPYETQCARILARNGSAALHQFQTRWIPMEEAYFSAFSVKNRCDLVVST